MYEKSSRNYPKNKEKLVPSKLDDFKNMLKITHVRGAKQGTQKSKKKALGSARVSFRTKSNLLETLVTNRLPKIFFVFLQRFNPLPVRGLRCFSVVY